MKRIWPNFFIVGAPRAGTTSLYEYLSQHPDIYMSPIKEPGFFSPLIQSDPFKIVWEQFLVTEESEYLSLFEGAEGYTAVGEATPAYLFDEKSPYLIQKKVPDAKIIVLLRDPVEQVHSHFWKIAMTVPFRSLYQALETSDWGWYLLESARYAKHLKRYFEVFGKERVLVLLFKDLKINPREVLKRVCEFLDVDAEPIRRIKFEQHNPTVAPRALWAYRLIMLRRKGILRNAPLPRFLTAKLRRFLMKKGKGPGLDKRTVERLVQEFEHEVAELEKLLGRSLPELRRSWSTEE